MGRVTFLTWPNRSHLVIVDTQSQAEALLILKDLDWKTFWVSSDTQLNNRTGTVLIPHEIYQVGISWPYCSSDYSLLLLCQRSIFLWWTHKGDFCLACKCTSHTLSSDPKLTNLGSTYLVLVLSMIEKWLTNGTSAFHLMIFTLFIFLI